MSVTSILDDLNPEQREAAETINGPLLILAGAGTGKTKTLTSRLAYMIQKGISPKSILMLTFTNNAAKEMQERAEKMIGEGRCKGLTACTFHAFCMLMLRKFGKRIGISSNFTVLSAGDAIDALSYCKGIYAEELKVSDEPDEKRKFYLLKESKFPKTTYLYNAISSSINRNLPLYICLNEIKDFCNKYNSEEKAVITDIVIELQKRYKDYKRRRSLLDFDDLLTCFLELMSADSDVALWVNNRFQYKMVDEYQDTNYVQLMIVRAISQKYNNVAVVGDDQQSIYGFNGARIENILEFNNEFKDCKTITLKQNYRSSQEILDMANAIILSASEKFDKQLIGQFHGLRPTVVWVPDNRYGTTEYLLSEVKRREQKGEKLNSIAIMYRSSYEVDMFERELIRQAIPYSKYGGIKLLDKVYVRDIMAFFRIVVNPKDELAWFRILQLYPNIGEVNSKKICDGIVANGVEAELMGDKYSKRVYYNSLISLWQLYEHFSGLSYEEQMPFILQYYFEQRESVIINSNMNTSEQDKALIQLEREQRESSTLSMFAAEYSSALEFVTDLALNTPQEQEDDGLILTTVHSAKGLEWDTCYYLNCIDQTLPKMNSDVEEERRCFYVAMTRPKKELILVNPQEYSCFGKSFKADYSMFLTESEEIKKTYDVTRM